MGQTESTPQEKEVVEKIAALQNELTYQSKKLVDAVLCSYEDFRLEIDLLNELSREMTHCGGRLLRFSIKEGTDSSMLWKATVRIAVIQMDAVTSKVVSQRLLTLPQFLRVAATIQDQLVPAFYHSIKEDTIEGPEESCSSTASQPGDRTGANGNVTYSMLLSKILAEGEDRLGECCICLERRPDVMLPCAHAYCHACIKQWNNCHKTCPICRAELESTDDAWVISDIPGSDDIGREICASLMDLATDPDSAKH